MEEVSFPVLVNSANAKELRETSASIAGKRIVITWYKTAILERKLHAGTSKNKIILQGWLYGCEDIFFDLFLL